MKGSVREKRPGYWELRTYAGRDPRTGRDRYVSKGFAGSKREAESALAQLVTEVAKGRHRSARKTMAVFLDEWADQASAEWEGSTERRYRSILRCHVVPALGRTDVAKVTVQQVDAFYRRMLASGLAPATIRQTHAILKRAFADAVRWGLRTDSPAAWARPPKVKRAEVTPPSPEALRALLAAAEARSPSFGALVRLAAATGARRGELCALRWSDIDGTELHIARALFDRTEKTTKTFRQRRLTLDKGTLARLDRHRAEMAARAARADLDLAPDAFAFSRDLDCGRPWHPDYVSHTWAALADACGAPDVRLHDLRHWSNSVLLDSGISVPMVQRRHGHRSGAMALDVYGHTVRASDVEAAEAIGRQLDPGARETAAGG